MAGTFSQIYIQVVFAVRGRRSLIHPEWEERLFKYMTGIIQNKNQKMLAINGVANHIHFLVGMKPSCCLSDLVREVKKSSNEFIHENQFSGEQFSWQEGFGAFSYSQSHLDRVVRYIHSQKEHHRVRTFKEEYLDLLKTYGVEYSEQHLFDWSVSDNVNK